MTETKTTKVTVTSPVDTDVACGVTIATVDGVHIGETGNWDPSLGPACSVHDAAFTKAAEGQVPERQLLQTDLTTQEIFIKSESKVGLLGLYAAVSAPVYILLGAGVGFFRYLYLGIKAQNKKQGGE